MSRPLPMPAAGSTPRPPFVFLGSGPGSAGTMPALANGVPVSSLNHSKAIPPSNSIPGTNGHINLRDRNRDDTLTAVRDRKVRITENASLYTLCRSWLRNGFPEEPQPKRRTTSTNFKIQNPTCSFVASNCRTTIQE